MMTLPLSKDTHIPNYATHNLGAGAVIINENNELLVGYLVHYAIGVIYGIIYVIFNYMFYDYPSVFLAIIIGFIAVLGSWCIIMPFAINIGFFASKKEERFQLMAQNLIAHFVFGIGLFIGYLLVF